MKKLEKDILKVIQKAFQSIPKNTLVLMTVDFINKITLVHCNITTDALMPNFDAGNINIDTIDFNKRAKNCLLAGNIDTIGKLVNLTRWDLLRIPGLGYDTLFDIMNTLAEHDLSLKD